MHAECCHVAAERRDAATGIDRLEPCEQVACLRERRRWRRIDPRQGRRVVAAPAGEFERERREVCLEDFGRGLRQQRVVEPTRSTAGNRCRARCGPRVPGAGRQTSARCARFRAGSCRWTGRSAADARRRRPTTMRTPSMVRLVSAMLVATTTLRRPCASTRSAASCSAAARSPYNGMTLNSFAASAAPSSATTRRISPAPGRNSSASPSCSINARMVTATTGPSMRALRVVSLRGGAT